MKKEKILVEIEKCCYFCESLIFDYEACIQPYYCCEKRNKQILSPFSYVCENFELNKIYKKKEVLK